MEVIPTIEEKWVVTVWKSPAFNPSYAHGYCKSYGSFQEALDAARNILKKKDKPFEWEYVITKIYARVFCGTPEIELTFEGDKSA